MIELHADPGTAARACLVEDRQAIIVRATVIKIRPTLGGAATSSGRMGDSHLPVARAHWSFSERIKKKTKHDV